eukprot:6212544-Pyramimonas_sp.AAC.1
MDRATWGVQRASAHVFAGFGGGNVRRRFCAQAVVRVLLFRISPAVKTRIFVLPRPASSIQKKAWLPA